MRFTRFLIIICCALLANVARAEDSLFDPAKHMLVSEVKTGMKGYGLTVFHGTKIEKFDVEVVSVVKNSFGPNQDVILIMCNDERMKHSGPVQGMSGSPIYLYDESGTARMIGAFAYGWGLSKDPLAGVQPIEYMLKLTPRPSQAPAPQANAAKGGSWNVFKAGLVPNSSRDLDWTKLIRLPAQNTTARNGLMPMSIPLSVGGGSPKLLETLKPIFEGSGFVPLAAGAGASDDTVDVEYEPGCSLVVGLLEGDLSLAAVGTTTEVIGDRVVGFGHPMFSEGDTAVPMNAGYVHTIVANLQSSFKLGTSGKAKGSLDLDTSVGVAGSLGNMPKYFPITVDVKWPGARVNRTFNYKAAVHDQYAPVMVGAAIQSSIAQMENLPKDATVITHVELTFDNGRTVKIDNESTTITGPDAALGGAINGAVLPVQAGIVNPFKKTMVTGVKATIEVKSGAKESMILSMRLDKPTYEPGDTATAIITLDNFKNPRSEFAMKIAIPEDFKDGEYSLMVGDGTSLIMSEIEANPGKFDVRSVDDLFDLFDFALSPRTDTVYAKLTHEADGVSLGGANMQMLPASRRALLAGTLNLNVMPLTSSVVTSQPFDHVISGAAQASVVVKKKN